MSDPDSKPLVFAMREARRADAITMACNAGKQNIAPIDLSGNKRLLIVKMSAIGDVVLASPVASALRRTYPRLRISWAVEEHTLALVNDNPNIDRVVIFPQMSRIGREPGIPQRALRALKVLRSEHYDIVLDLQGLLRSAIVAMLSGAPVRVGLPRRREGAHLILRRIPIPKGCHVVEEYLACASFLGASTSEVSFHVPLSTQALVAVEDLLQKTGVPKDLPIAIINPSTSGSWRSWSIENWRTVARLLAKDLTVLVVGAAAQQPRHAEVARDMNGRVFDLTGRTTLLELIALLSLCSVHLAGDTGSAHIAAALGLPVVGVYGPTNPLRVSPWRQQDWLVYHPGLCGSTCPGWCLRNRSCLRAITPEEVVAKARAALTATLERTPLHSA
jgi:heptosyltransferase I